MYDNGGGYDVWGAGNADSGGGWAGSGFSGGGNNTAWLTPYLQPQGGDVQSGTGLNYDPISNAWQNSQGGMISSTPQSQPAGNWLTNLLPMARGGTGGGAPAGGGGAGGGGGNASPWLGAAMGSLGPMAGLIGTLMGGGQGATTGPKPNTQQKANMGYGNQQAQLAAGGNLPAQQMQMSLLQALQSGQGLPPGYQQLIEQAYQPQMGDLYSQAAAAGRARGFHDAPATSPVGSAILGPGLSNLQGQMAQSKLGMMQSLPALYNQPIATQGNFAQNYMNAAQNPATMQQTTTNPMAPQIGQAVGGLISGGAQGYNAAVGQNQQQQTLDSLLKSLQTNQTGGMSQVKLAQGGIVTQPTNALIGEAGPEAVIPLAGDQGRVLQNILQQGAASRGPQPNPQPPRNPASLLDILRLLGIAQGPDRQLQLGSR